MKLRAYVRTWQQIDLTSLAVTADRPAGPELYQQFYVKLDQGCGAPDQHWRTTKRTLGEGIAHHVFEQWESCFHRRPRILALAVGVGAAEGVWLEHGYDVTLHDCQETSLRSLREQFPEAPIIIADLRSIMIPTKFDIIVILASEYMLSNRELADFLEAAKLGLSDDGCLVLHSVSILSMVRLAKECVKRWRHSRTGRIFWGWFRTPAELARSAIRAGFRVATSYRVGVNGSNTVLKKRSRLLRTQPTLNDESVLLVLRP
jgi:hypothetical protein